MLFLLKLFIKLGINEFMLKEIYLCLVIFYDLGGKFGWKEILFKCLVF